MYFHRLLLVGSSALILGISSQLSFSSATAVTVTADDLKIGGNPEEVRSGPLTRIIVTGRRDPTS